MCKNKSTVTEDENTLPDINLQGKQLSDLRCSLILYLENNGYAEKAIHRYNHELDLLQVMMNEKGVIYYTTDIGEQFCQQRSQSVNDYGLQITIKRIIFRLNCLQPGLLNHKATRSTLCATTWQRRTLAEKGALWNTF